MSLGEGKRSFLLSKSVQILAASSIGKYDAALDINICMLNGGEVPSVLCSNTQATQSKTMASPGDDDPDKEAEICY